MIETKPTKLAAQYELLRVEKLRDYQILDTHSEDTFDKIALMASQVFDTPYAFITFVDENRVFIKSNLSDLNVKEVERDASLCNGAINEDQVTVIQDTAMLPNYRACEVAYAAGIRFYAGAPLKTPEGYNVGMICVCDTIVRDATPVQINMLRTLAKIIVDKLENRLTYRKTIESQINLMNIALHEIKNPLASIKLANEILKSDDTKKEKMSDMIKSSVATIQKKLSDLLKHSELEEKDLYLQLEQLDMQEIFNRLLNNFELLAQQKNQTIELHCEDGLPHLEADRTKLMDILHNLLSNAIKYSYPGGIIKISAREAGNYLHIEVKDDGQGLNVSDLQRLYTKFAKLSSRPT
ncbi:hypothetical protein VF12_40260, partial [Nostoc linckia z15]